MLPIKFMKSQDLHELAVRKNSGFPERCVQEVGALSTFLVGVWAAEFERESVYLHELHLFQLYVLDSEFTLARAAMEILFI